jgi:hypothetical protein
MRIEENKKKREKEGEREKEEREGRGRWGYYTTNRKYAFIPHRRAVR